ncbi:MAG TPA: hypothetical protein VFH61_17655, partial [Thermoleophilia bacterium]|nr:hypothetical protein [Thermoleophilia bacterium]
MPLRTCTHCRKAKTPDAFTRNAQGVGGLSWWCRDCTRAASQKQRAVLAEIAAAAAPLTEEQSAAAAHAVIADLTT